MEEERSRGRLSYRILVGLGGDSADPCDLDLDAVQPVRREVSDLVEELAAIQGADLVTEGDRDAGQSRVALGDYDRSGLRPPAASRW